MSGKLKYIDDFKKITNLIVQTRIHIYKNINKELIYLYWTVGKYISAKIKSSVWGEKVIDDLAYFIKENYIELKGFSRRSLYRMKQFYETYSVDSDCYKAWDSMTSKKVEDSTFKFVSALPSHLQLGDNQEQKIVSALLAQISWSNHLEILSSCESAEEKIFYLLLSKNENLSMRELRRQIKTSLYERTMLANKSIKRTQANMSGKAIGLFRDTYVFEFLDLPENYLENDLRKALLQNLKKFILEIGKGFTFIGEEFRLQVGNKDYSIDLLFYNRDLQCLISFELKIEDFKPEFIGKMNFYLEVLDREIKKPYENPSIGVLLCKGKDSEVVEFATARNISPTLVADYKLKLIDKGLLQRKLREFAELYSNIDK